MGGPGSGNRIRLWTKDTTESQKWLDVRWLKKQGYLDKHISYGTLSWSCGDRESGSIQFRISNDKMTLIYKFRYRDSEWEDVEQTVFFDKTPCNFGGYRYWFLCPRCSRRVAVLYGAGKYFLCRHCYNLCYSSQQENYLDRQMRKSRKIRRRLGASESLFDPIFFKPKRMHGETFIRLSREATEIDRKVHLALLERFR